jgi:adenylyltransferase/sulfurtransferase
MTLLSELAKVRYSRQIKLSNLGEYGQALLINSRVLLIGAGGLSTPIAIYLAGAGVGTIGIVDPDRVHISNLHRQVAFTSNDAAIRSEKAIALEKHLVSLNPEVTVVAKCIAVDETNVFKIIADYDLVIDGSDNLATKFIVSGACQQAAIPLLTGAVHAMSCQIALFITRITACYNCLFKELPKDAPGTCEEDGVLGTVVGTAALMIATEALKLLSGGVPAILGKMLIYDAESQTLRSFKISRDEHCRTCGAENNHGKEFKLVEITNQITAAEACQTKNQRTISVAHAKQLMDKGAVLIDVREEQEFNRGSIASARNYPLSRLLSDVHKKIFEDCKDPVILFCQTGKRSLHALEVLNSSLLSVPVYSLVGGVDRWISENSYL